MEILTLWKTYVSYLYCNYWINETLVDSKKNVYIIIFVLDYNFLLSFDFT